MDKASHASDVQCTQLQIGSNHFLAPVPYTRYVIAYAEKRSAEHHKYSGKLFESQGALTLGLAWLVVVILGSHFYKSREQA
jgi:hypothetical protein